MRSKILTFLGGHLLKMIMQNGIFSLLLLQSLDVLIQKWLKQLNSISLNLEVNESVAEKSVAIGHLQVELSFQK